MDAGSCCFFRRMAKAGDVHSKGGVTSHAGNQCRTA